MAGALGTPEVSQEQLRMFSELCEQETCRHTTAVPRAASPQLQAW